jgi:hypothetical protein
VTLAEQATYTTNFINEVAESYPYVTAVMIYQGVDSSGDVDPPSETDAGILNTQLAPKPIYYALATLYGH